MTDYGLERKAERFIQLRLARHGWTLHQYIVNPERGEQVALRPEPLLPQQQKIARRMEGEQ